MNRIFSTFSINELSNLALLLVRATEKKISKDILNLRLGRNKRPIPFIVSTKTGTYAGSTVFMILILLTKPCIDTPENGKGFRGTGLNKIVNLLLQFAFETLGIERIEFRADNIIQSIVAMKVLLHRRRCFTQACAYFRKYIAT
jgi:hypothetical protein